MCTGLELLAGAGAGGAGAGAGIGSTLLSAALPAVGALYNARMQQQYIDARNAEQQKAMAMEAQARQAEDARQRQMEQVQAQRVTDALMRAEPEQGAEQVREVAVEQPNEIRDAADTYNLTRLPGQRGSTEVSDMIARTVGEERERARGIMENRALLTGQDNWLQSLQDELVRMAGDISNEGSFRQESLGVSRMETNVPAAQVTPSASPWGDLMMLGGQALAGHIGQLRGYNTKPGGWTRGARNAAGAVYGVPFIGTG